MKLNGHDESVASTPHERGPGATALSSAISESVDVRIDTFVGDTAISIAKLNKLKNGDILPLDASLADLVELRVNGIHIAMGELVAVGDKFGVRITKIS